jgi:hypothetical protein
VAGARVAGFAARGGNYVGRFRAERPEFAQGAHRKETVRQYSVALWPVNFSRGRAGVVYRDENVTVTAVSGEAWDMERGLWI